MTVSPVLRRRPCSGDPQALPDTIHPVLRRVYAARGVASEDDLSCRLGALAAPDALGGTSTAASQLADVVVSRGSVLVVGDFDADGATSCALVVSALQAMGLERADYLVPDRFEFGYGLSPGIARVAAARRPDLLITVDNGISSLDGVAAAREAGLGVIVTDHHLPGSALPAANAIVNPNLDGDPFPSKALAGVGVAFYVMLALRAELRQRGWFRGRGVREPNLADLLDLVALGTVADVVALDRNNRILVEQGLRRIRAGHGRAGICAMLELGGREPRMCSSADLGFAVAPRLNAAGRLQDMSIGIECLLARDPTAAADLAQTLDDLNRERRQIERRMRDEAMAVLDGHEWSVGDVGAVSGICVADDGWHQGVIGILASRLRERFHRPTVALAPSGDGNYKGSGRSVPGLHLRDALARIATDHPGMITAFGGHAMAAGLTLRGDCIAAFRSAFDERVFHDLPPEALRGELLTDGPLAADEIGMPLAVALRDGGPWGQGFPEPVFEGRFRIRERRIVGEHHLRMRLVPHPGGTAVDAIAFDGVSKGWAEAGDDIRVAYHLEVNRFRGRESPQMRVLHLDAGFAEGPSGA